MAKQTRYNYRGTPQGSRLGHEAEIERLRRTPTAKQYRFCGIMRKQLRENGVDPGDTPDNPTRADMSREIDRLLALCKENGIEMASNGKQFAQVITIGNNGFKGGFTAQERLVPSDQLDHRPPTDEE
jgi:hypothetical protein